MTQFSSGPPPASSPRPSDAPEIAALPDRSPTALLAELHARALVLLEAVEQLFKDSAPRPIQCRRLSHGEQFLMITREVDGQRAGRITFSASTLGMPEVTTLTFSLPGRDNERWPYVHLRIDDDLTFAGQIILQDGELRVDRVKGDIKRLPLVYEQIVRVQEVLACGTGERPLPVVPFR